MTLILFDQEKPVPLRTFLIGHAVKTADEQGWSTLANGKLLDAAEAAGFEVLVTQIRTCRTSKICLNASWPVWCWGMRGGPS